MDYILTRAPDTIILPWYASTLSLSIGMECTTSSNYNKGFPPLFYKQEAALIHCFSSFWRTLNPLGFPRLALSSHSCRDIMCTENYTICFLYILLFILLRFNLQGSFRMQMIIYIYPPGFFSPGFLFNKRYFVIRKLWHFAALGVRMAALAALFYLQERNSMVKKNVRAAVFIVTWYILTVNIPLLYIKDCTPEKTPD